jgi:pimeloyl-ACP methyl ester carboxylesterase
VYILAVQIVFLHALPFDGRMWNAERDLLERRVLAPRLYELGDSVEAWAAAVLQLAGREPCVVVGCSVGGSCALEIARAAPDQVAGIVLIGAKAGVRPDPTMRDEAIRLLETRGIEAAWAKYWAPLFGRNASHAVVAAARDLALSQNVDDLVRGVRAFHDRRDLTDWVARWRRPLIVISGAEDLTPPPSTAAWLGVGPMRRFHLVEDCGHYVSLERPETFRSLLASTLPDGVGAEVSGRVRGCPPR